MSTRDDHCFAEQNRKSWNLGAEAYARLVHSKKAMERVTKSPQCAFHKQVWASIRGAFPDFRDVRVCVPSSGDNIAVFAFAMLGARVTSCDIAENQLANAEKVAREYDWGQRIEFVRTNTMDLSGVQDAAYDFVYTSNGVHVWIDDLNAMYRSVRRILKPFALYMMYDIHPGLRPFRNDMTVYKPYDMTGPFRDNDEINFTWRTMDIVNAMTAAGLSIEHMDEMYAEKSYEFPFWLSLRDAENGVMVPRDEVDRMYDWHNNPMMALPNWLSIAARALP